MFLPLTPIIFANIVSPTEIRLCLFWMPAVISGQILYVL